MDKKLIIGVVVAALVVAGGWLLLSKKSQTTPSDSPAPSISAPTPTQQQNSVPVTKTLVVDLSSQNNSGESGVATLIETDGKTNVTLALSGAPAGVTQPAHIHTGSCAAIGGVVYPLTFPVNGMSETTLDVTIDQLLAQLPLAINVHKSVPEASVYVACGDITSTSTVPATGPSPTTPAPTTINDDRDGEGGPFSTPTDRRRGADKPED